MFNSRGTPNPGARIVKPRASERAAYRIGEPVSRYRFTFYREFNNGQPDPAVQNALIMRREIVLMKIKQSRLLTIGDVSRRLNKTNAPVRTRATTFLQGPRRNFTTASLLTRAKICFFRLGRVSSSASYKENAWR